MIKPEDFQSDAALLKLIGMPLATKWLTSIRPYDIFGAEVQAE